MRRLAVKISGGLLIMGLIAPNAFAHGGVSIEADKWVLKIGKYLMHFTGYQPENSGGEEFCEDIPSTGHAIIVMDFVRLSTAPHGCGSAHRKDGHLERCSGV
ncbi:MAG: hypothetical protein ACREX4_19470 [Gammaproteobacteria bacterium]